MSAHPDSEVPVANRLDVDRGPAVGNLDVRWIHGHPAGRPDRDPPIQVHAFDAHTFILRQSKTVHAEAPFLYLLCGNDRALLLDTGATEDFGRFPLRATVDGLIAGWLQAHPRQGYQLVVAHSHAHADHVAADAQFAGRPDTTIVPAALDPMRAFWGLDEWPDGVATLDLGGRRLEIVGCPGHHETAIAVFDPWSGFLLTGDTVYPGRLFVADEAAFAASLDRLVDFAASRPVTHLMGGHVEMTRRPGHDHPMGALHQPDEPPLQMAPRQLSDVRDALASIAGRRGVHRFAGFIIVNRPGLPAMVGMIGRALWHRLARWRPPRRRSVGSRPRGGS